VIRRLPDWPEKLAAYIADNRAARFAWGVNDCALFAAGAVLAMTGQWLPLQRWTSAKSAARAQRAAGGLAVAVDAVLPRLAGPAFAQRGDVVLAQADDGRRLRQWLCVVDAGCWWAPGFEGLRRGDMKFAVAAWGVGHA
jgi:hypothetical protein